MGLSGSGLRQVSKASAGAGAPRARSRARDRRLDVELLSDLRVLADQLACSARQLLAGRCGGFPDVDAPHRSVVSSEIPGFEPEAGNLLELVDRLMPQVAAQLVDRRLEVGEIPEDDRTSTRYSKKRSW
jgi:hypothetical protein